MRALRDEGTEQFDFFVGGASYMTYDLDQLGGRETIGGNNGPNRRGFNTGASVSARSCANLFGILALTQSANAQPAVWRNYSALGNLMSEYVKIANEKAGQLTQDDFIEAARRALHVPIDGIEPAEWLASQHVMYTYGKPGKNLFVWSQAPLTSGIVNIYAFERTDKEILPGIPEEKPIATGTVYVRITDWNGNVYLQRTVDLASTDGKNGYFMFDPKGMKPGAYRIQASGYLDGTEAVSPDFYRMQFDTMQFPNDIASAWAWNKPLGALIFIGVNPDGSIATTPLAPIAGGKFLQNANGAAFWLPDAGTLPGDVIVNGKPVTMFAPFSRVLSIQNP
jgi:hypothetical protein